ncbi:undecaprenyl diphosphate synthase family protein, partial [Neisseria sicca]|uniref:undecaprenyl diphosphate synthase family protein n=1 Tax=Neisseria sicca TaxID=490 RepID=UPI0034D96FDC
MFQPIQQPQPFTPNNTPLTLTIPPHYPPPSHIFHPPNKLIPQPLSHITQHPLPKHFILPDAPHPHFFIPTPPQRPITNFLLSHIPYPQLYFTHTLSPDFHTKPFHHPLPSFQKPQPPFPKFPILPLFPTHFLFYLIPSFNSSPRHPLL